MFVKGIPSRWQLICSSLWFSIGTNLCRDLRSQFEPVNISTGFSCHYVTVSLCYRRVSAEQKGEQGDLIDDTGEENDSGIGEPTTPKQSSAENQA